MPANRRIFALILTLAALFIGSAAQAGISEEEDAQAATRVLRDIVAIPEQGIPPALLSQAYGVAVIPDVLKVGFIFGGRRGEGLLSVRAENGKWSNPIFVSLTGASVGFQIGASKTDVILVFKTPNSVRRLAEGKITLGGEASVAAGPVGRSAEAATDIQLDAEIYSYSRARGLFAGVSAEGGAIQIEAAANADFYNEPGVNPYAILGRTKTEGIPPSGREFVNTLERYAPRPR